MLSTQIIFISPARPCECFYWVLACSAVSSTISTPAAADKSHLYMSGGTATVGSAHTSGVKSDRVKQEPVRHSNEFEKSIIEHTEQRCARMRAEWLVSESLLSYLQKAQRVIEDETFSTSHFKCKIKLHASIKEKLRCVREEKLLKIPENAHFVGRYPLGDKYYKQKGHIKELVDPYTGIVVTNSGAKLKLDQSHLETVIPAKGRTVIILRGKRKGHEAILRDIIVEEFKAELEFSDGDLLTLPYEEFSKKYQE